MTIKTHLRINQALCGQVLDIHPGQCTLALALTDTMRADEHGLVHGGFIFGAADYAAMLAINEPLVVLGEAQVRFMKPSRVGETLTFKALVTTDHPRKPAVEVEALNEAGVPVFRGLFSCVVPQRPVLDRAA